MAVLVVRIYIDKSSTSLEMDVSDEKNCCISYDFRLNNDDYLYYKPGADIYANWLKPYGQMKLKPKPLFHTFENTTLMDVTLGGQFFESGADKTFKIIRFSETMGCVFGV